MADIFLSYASEDRPRAGQLASALQSRGWTVWWDRRIPAGRDFTEVIESELRDARCMIVLWTRESVQSRWVRDEANEGNRQRKLVPVLLEAVDQPMGFRGIQAADLVGWDGSADTPGFQRFIVDLNSTLGAPASSALAAPPPAESQPALPPEPVPPASQPGTRRTPWSPRVVRTVLVAGAAILAIGLSAWGLMTYKAAADRRAYELREADRLRAEAEQENAERVRAERERAEKEKAEREAAARRRRVEDAERTRPSSQTLKLSETVLDFGAREAGSGPRAPRPLRVVLTNQAAGMLMFTLRSVGPDTSAFRIVRSDCSKTSDGLTLDRTCWLEYDFFPAREGPHRNLVSFQVVASSETHSLTLTGVGGPSPAGTAAGAKVLRASCIAEGGNRFRVELSGEATGPVGAYLYGASNPNNGIAAGSNSCSSWSSVSSEDGSRPNVRCKRGTDQPATTNWKSSNLFTSKSGAPPSEGVLSVYEGEDRSTYRGLARDRVPLDCKPSR